MREQTFTSREFNQDTSRAKKAAGEGPVFITDRGRPAHVLLTYADYLKLTGTTESMADLLAMPAEEYFDVDFPTRADLGRAADLS